MKDQAYVLARINQLMELNNDTFPERMRIRHIMNGGSDGIQAVMQWDFGKGSSGRISDKLGVDLPTVNLMASGLERTAQQLGRMPTLKAPPADDKTARKKNQKRIDILAGWDRMQRLELHYPQVGRWLPGYGYAMWIITQRRNADGELYPVAELRDPYDTFPGWFGATQQPYDAATTRVVELWALEAAYPEYDWPKLERALQEKRTKALLDAQTEGRMSTGSGLRTRSWEGKQSGIQVVEYFCDDGTHICIPELGIRLGHIENPLSTPAFVFVKRFSFDRLQSQYHHIIGLMGMMAKMNVMALIQTNDSTFRETNIVGEMKGNTYRRGRFAVNEFEPGTRIEKPTLDVANQTWAQIDRLERQLRIGANYDVQQDAISPNSFATGQGMRELKGAANANIREYQTALKYASEDIDHKRLEWADVLYGSKPRTYYDMYGKKQTYRPSRQIKGDYRTRRVYGAMATFDDAQKVVVGLQLLQGGIIDVETLRENIDGLEDLPLIDERSTRTSYRGVLQQRLAARTEQDPRADAIIARIMANPDQEEEILEEYFAPKQEQQQASPMAAPPQAGGAAAPPESMTSVLSRLEMSGAAEGGVQTVGNL